jgi:hypothetical protein
MRNQIMLLVILMSTLTLSAQTMIIEVSKDSMMDKSNMKSSFCNIVKGGGKYLFNSSKNTRETLASAGYVLDQPAIEYYLQYKDLPKLFYSQQLGTISGSKYASINGFGIKKDIRKAIFATDNIMLTPYAEFGLGYYRLSVIEGIGESSSINAVLDGGVQQRTLDNITVTGDLGLDLGFGFKFDDRRLMLILSGGYMSNFPTQWRSAGSIAFNEKLNILSPYAGVSLALDMSCGDGCCK